MRKSILFVLSVLVLLSMLLSACGPTATQLPAPEPTKAEDRPPKNPSSPAATKAPEEPAGPEPTKAPRRTGRRRKDHPERLVVHQRNQYHGDRL